MSENQSASKSVDDDPRTDPLNPLLALALAEQALPPLEPDFDSEQCGDVLTDDDRRVLDSLGSPKEVIHKALGRLHPDSVASIDLSDVPTHGVSMSTTDPAPGSRFSTSESPSERDELMGQMRSCEQEEIVDLPSNYLKTEELGRGGQGVVFLLECQDEFAGKHAYKIFSPERYRSKHSYQEEMKRLLHVASLLHRLHIDNLVGVERFVKRRDIYAMVMQWIDGFDLRRLIQPTMLERLREHVEPIRWEELGDVVYNNLDSKEPCLQPGYAVNIAEKILRALDALHSVGIVHRDIKPANIMLDTHGSIKLIDIGSAAEISNPPQHRNWTPLYAPPEFLEKREWTVQSDLASLGYVLIELLCGRRSVMGPAGDQSTIEVNNVQVGKLLEAKSALCGSLTKILPAPAQESAQLVKLCQRLIDPDPRNRYSSAGEAIEGTFEFHKQLTQGDLTVHYASHFQGWLTDAKKANLQL